MASPEVPSKFVERDFGRLGQTKRRIVETYLSLYGSWRLQLGVAVGEALYEKRRVDRTGGKWCDGCNASERFGFKDAEADGVM